MNCFLQLPFWTPTTILFCLWTYLLIKNQEHVTRCFIKTINWYSVKLWLCAQSPTGRNPCLSAMTTLHPRRFPVNAFPLKMLQGPPWQQPVWEMDGVNMWAPERAAHVSGCILLLMPADYGSVCWTGGQWTGCHRWERVPLPLVWKASMLLEHKQFTFF